MDTKYSSISMSIANLLLLIVCACTIPTQLLAQDASEPTHEWVVLIPGSEIGEDEGSFWGTEFGFNSKTGILYSFNATKVTAYNLIEGQKSTVPIDPPPLTRWVFTLDVQNNRFIAGRSGRGNLYAAPLEGGSWTQIGNGYNDGESYGANYFWNPVSGSVAYFGGYGFYSMKNWLYENRDQNWVAVYPNNNGCAPAKRLGQLATSKDGTVLYIFSGQGNCSGDQRETSCSLGSPWASDSGAWCWLRDLWSYDMNTESFTNLLPPNSPSIEKEGSFAFDYDREAFYNIGGCEAPTVYGQDMSPTCVDDVYRYKVGSEGFEIIQVDGQAPVSSQYERGQAYYDSPRSRIIYASSEGIFALNITDSGQPGLGNLPVPKPSYPTNNQKVYTNTPDLSFYLGTAQGSLTFDIEVEVSSAQDSWAPVCSSPAGGVAKTSFSTRGCDPALLAGHKYRWRVRSSNGAKVSAWSSWASFTTNGAGLAAKPILSYPADSLGQLEIYTTAPDLSWYTGVDNSGIDFEALYLKRAGVAPESCEGMYDGADKVSTSGITHARVKDLEMGATYDWCVRSEGDNGEVYSKVSSFTIAYGWVSDATYALWPTNNQIVYLYDPNDPSDEPQRTDPTLFWFTDGSQVVEEYDLEYCVLPEVFGGVCTIVDSITEAQYQIADLAEGDQVRWRVKPSGSDAAAWDNTASQGAFRVYEANGEYRGGPLATPWYPVDNVTVSGTSVPLAWYATGASGLPTYIIEYSSDKSFPDDDQVTFEETTDQAAFYLDISDLTEGHQYYWRVRASSDGGDYGPWSATASFTIEAGESAPQPLIGGPNNGVGITSSSPTLSWIIPSASSSDVVYDVRYAAEGGAYTELTDLALPFIQVDALEEGDYTWQVRTRTVDGSSISAYSDRGRFTTTASMGVDTEEEMDLPVAYELGQNYPNPFNPQTTIPFALPSSQKVSLVVYDMLGRQLEVLVDGVMSAGNHQAVWNAQNMPSGMYVYRLTTPNGVQTRLMQLIK